MQLCCDKRCLFDGSNGPIKKDFKIVVRETREGEGLWEKCNKCNLVINRTGVPRGEEKEFYNNEYVQLNSFEKGKNLSPLEHYKSRLKSVIPIASYLKSFLNRDMRLLEIGAGTGELLDLLSNNVGNISGNEINQDYASFISEELKINSSSEDYMQLKYKPKLDFIISINSIDHMFEPRKVVEKMHKDLNRGGFVYIEVPNDEQALKKYLPEPSVSRFKKFMYQKAHYYSFNKDTLLRMIEEIGFEIIDINCRHDYTLKNYRIIEAHNSKITNPSNKKAFIYTRTSYKNDVSVDTQNEKDDI